MRYLFPLLILAIAFTSCSKDQEDLIAPEIDIISPAQGSSYIPENDVAIRINITENDDLHNYKAQITDDAQNVLWEEEGHEHGTELSISDDWFAPAGFNGSCTLKVAAEDHNGNAASASVDFTIAP